MRIPKPDEVCVTHWSEYTQTVATQVMSMKNARDHFSRLTEYQKSAYSIRPAGPSDYEIEDASRALLGILKR